MSIRLTVAGLGVYLFRLLMPGANTDGWRAFAQWVFGLVRSARSRLPTAYKREASNAS